MTRLSPRRFASIIALMLGAAALGPASRAADQPAPQPTARDWSENGRWLTPYELPGYRGYAVTWPTARRVAARPDATRPAAPSTPR
jgi:hypothetical protein